MCDCLVYSLALVVVVSAVHEVDVQFKASFGEEYKKWNKVFLDNYITT